MECILYSVTTIVKPNWFCLRFVDQISGTVQNTQKVHHVHTIGVNCVRKVYGEVMTTIPPVETRLERRSRNAFGVCSWQMRFAASTQSNWPMSSGKLHASPRWKRTLLRSWHNINITYITITYYYYYYYYILSVNQHKTQNVGVAVHDDLLNLASLLFCLLGLYRIYFFQSSQSRILLDLEWQIQPEPDLQIDCNFTDLMCKTIRMYEWFEFLIIFCAAVTITSFTCTHAVIYATAWHQCKL